MAAINPSKDYDLNLTFRSVFAKNDEYQPPPIELPPARATQLYQLLDAEYRTTVQQGMDAVSAVLNLSLSDIPLDLLNDIGRAVTDGYDSANTGVKKEMGDPYSVPASRLTGLINLPGSWSALVCVDDRGVVKVCGLNVSYRVITDANVIDLSLVCTKPGS